MKIARVIGRGLALLGLFGFCYGLMGYCWAAFFLGGSAAAIVQVRTHSLNAAGISALALAGGIALLFAARTRAAKATAEPKSQVTKEYAGMVQNRP